jgi:GT2 family glycosyltransferase
MQSNNSMLKSMSFRKRRQTRTAINNLVSIFLRCDGFQEEDVWTTLNCLRQQSYRNFEVLLIGRSANQRDWECLAPFRGIAGVIDQNWQDHARGEYAMFLLPGDRLLPHALEEINLATSSPGSGGDCSAVIFDYRLNGAARPQFLPGWDPNLLEYFDYVQRGFCVSRQLLEPPPPDPFHNGLVQFTLLNRQTQLNVKHVAKPLAEFTGALPVSNWTTEVKTPLPPLSIIIPNRNSPSLLPRCVEFIRKLPVCTELIVVDNSSDDEAIWKVYHDLKTELSARIIRCTGTFNYSKMINLGVLAATHEHILFLNNDVIIDDPASVLAALNYALRPNMGVVGSLLRYPDGRVQHAGMILRLDGSEVDAEHVLRLNVNDEGSYPGALTAPKSWQCVTGAFQLTRKSVFLDAGGYDEVNLPTEHSDTDFCLRVRNRGFGVVCLPLGGVTHYESYTRSKMPGEKTERLNREARYVMRARWFKEFANDPYLNPNIDSKDSTVRLVKTVPGALRNCWSLVSAELSGSGELLARKLSVQSASLARQLKPGLCIVGPFSSRGQIGQQARQIAEACDRARLPTSFVEISYSSDRLLNEPADSMCLPRTDREIALFLSDFSEAGGGLSQLDEGRTRVIRPHFGEAVTIAAAVKILEQYDEVWVPSGYLRTRLAGVLRTPLRVIPPIVTDSGADAVAVPLKHTVFETLFNYNSSTERQNIEGTIQIFQRAFRDVEQVRLIIATRGVPDSGVQRQLQQWCKKDRRISIEKTVDEKPGGRTPREESSVFLSLHRMDFAADELLAAMIRGRVIISTNWGAMSDFVHEERGFAVGPTASGTEDDRNAIFEWREPCVDEAIQALREVYNDPGEASSRARAARAFVRDSNSARRIGCLIGQEINRLRLAQSGDLTPPDSVVDADS